MPSPHPHPEWEPMTAFVADMSYFSGKLEGYLRYKEVPYERRVVTATVMRKEVLPATGLMKVPVVRMANGAWLKDTTPMIDFFETHYPTPEVVPSDPVLRFVSKLVEDYADEWCWRAALYWRWCFPNTRRLLMRRIGREVLGDWPLPASLTGWYYGRRQIATYLKGDGLTAQTEPAIRQHYIDLLDNMALLLADQDFLLGNQPSLVDFGLFGPMFRHYAQDPAPNQVMLERAPSVFAWVGRVWNARGSAFVPAPTYTSFAAPGWQFFLRDIVQNYWPLLRQNALAWQEGRSRLDHDADGVRFRNLKVVRYRVYCLEVLQNEYLRLDASARASVDALLAPHGTLELLDGVDSGLLEEHRLPLDARPAFSTWQKARLAVTGTPWDMPPRPRPR